MGDQNKNVPRLRFPGYTDAWVKCEIGKFSESYSGGTPSVRNIDYYGGNIPFIRSAEINANSTELFLTEEGIVNSSAKMVQRGDILYALYGATSGEVGISRINGAINQAILAIKLNENKDDSMFLMQWLQKQKAQIINTFIQGGQGNLSGQIVKNLIVSRPCIEEQKQIGAFFNQLNNTITVNERELNKLKNLKKSYLEKMFPKNGSDIPELRFPGYTDAWVKCELGNVVSINSGRDYKHLSIGEIPVYGTGGYMLSVDDCLSKNKDAIGIGRKGTIDKPYILYAPFWTVDTLYYAIPVNGNDINFIHSIFQLVNWKQLDESTGVPSLSKITINFVNAYVPCFEEQTKIGKFFKQLDDLITVNERELNKLKELKKSYLKDMFV